MRFGDDWPGTFIRGDDAFSFRIAISSILQLLEKSDSVSEMQKWIATENLKGLCNLLGMSDMNSLREKLPQ